MVKTASSTHNQHINNRLNYIDVAKGILIILVLINHVGNLAIASGVDNATISTIPSLRFWCPFFMPAFFVIAGMCSNYDMPLKTFILKNFKALIIPAFTLLFVRIILRYVLDGSISTLELSYFIHHYGIKALLTVGYWNWFLVAMFTTKLLYWIINRSVNKITVQTAICVTCYLSGFVLVHRKHDSILFFNVWFYQHALLFVIFILIGRLIKNRYTPIIKEWEWIIASTMIFAILYTIFVINGWRIPKITSDIFLTKYDLLPHLIMSVTGTLSVLGICYKVGSIKYLEMLGQKSLVIYCLHFPVFFSFFHMFHTSLSEMGIHTTITALLILHVFTLWITIIAANILETRHLKFILGKF